MQNLVFHLFSKPCLLSTLSQRCRRICNYLGACWKMHSVFSSVVAWLSVWILPCFTHIIVKNKLFLLGLISGVTSGHKHSEKSKFESSVQSKGMFIKPLWSSVTSWYSIDHLLLNFYLTKLYSQNIHQSKAQEMSKVTPQSKM